MQVCGRNSMVEFELPKLATRVRSPSPAPYWRNMERANRPLAEALRALLILHKDAQGKFRLPEEVSTQQLLKVVHAALKEEFTYFENAQDVVWDVARHAGYIIPACPVESRGDARAFLAEEGVQNTREWYKARGFSETVLHNLFTTGAFMARNQGFWRRLIALPKCADTSASTLAPYIIEIIDFCLGDDTKENNPALFQC